MDTDAPTSSSHRDRSDRDRSDRDRDPRDRHDPRDSRDPRETRYASSSRDSRAFDPARKAINREFAATEAAKKSRKECRVYVGNLAFGVKWNDLKDFMREGGSKVVPSSSQYRRHGRTRVSSTSAERKRAESGCGLA